MKKLVVGIVAVIALLIGLWVVVERLMSAAPRRVEGTTVTRPAPPRVEQPAGDAPPASDAASARSVEPAPEVEAEGGVIAGRVYDADTKAPLLGVTVEAEAYVKGQRVERSVETDGQGDYRLTHLAEGLYRVSAFGPTHYGKSREKVRVGSKHVDFMLKGMGEIEGRVVHASNGAPVRDFEILVSTGRTRELTTDLRGEAKSVHDKKGGFRLTHVHVGHESTIIVIASGFATSFTSVTVNSTQKPLRDVVIRLEPEAVVRGVVIDDSGKAVSGAAVGLGRLPYSEYNIERERGASTDAEGTFRMDGLAPEPVTLWVHHPDYVPASVDVDPRELGADILEIELSSGSIIEGTVWRGERPARGASVGATDAAGERVALRVRTESDGSYRLMNVRPGLVTVRAFVSPDVRGYAGYHYVEKVIEIERNEVAQVDVVFLDGDAELDVSVAVEAQPPRQATAITTFLTESGELQGCKADYDVPTGYCRLHQLPSGTLTLRVQAVSHNDVTRCRILSVGTEPGRVTRVDVDLSGTAAISGRASGFRDGTVVVVGVFPGAVPVPDFSIEGLSGLEFANVGASIADETGAFHIEGLDAGTYTVIAMEWQLPSTDEAPPSPHRHVQAVVEVADGAEIEVTLTLE